MGIYGNVIWGEEMEGFWEEALEGPKRFEKLCRDFGEKIWRGVLRKWKEWGKLMKNRGRYGIIKNSAR